MKAPKGLTIAELFFWDNAGYSWNSANGETREAGRERGARNLAAAEGVALESDYTFDWSQSDIDSSDFSDASPAWALYDCLMCDAAGKVVQSLSACDFGNAAGGPYGDYRRVVEAELASQELHAMLEGLQP